METPFIKKHFAKMRKSFWRKISGCAYCPLKESCDLKKQQEKNQNKAKIAR